MNNVLTFLPDWGAWHVMVIHFPITLLSLVPLFIIAGLLTKSRAISLASLFLLIIGTLFLLFAVGTGEVASDSVQGPVDVIETLKQHDSLALKSRTVFIFLSFFYTLLILWDSGLLPKIKIRPARWLYLGFLLIYVGGVFLIFQTAYYGALLVHRHGVHSTLHKIN